MTLPPPTPKQARVIWLAVTGLALATLVALVVALIWGLGRVVQTLSPVLWPLAVAGVIAYLLDPLVDRFERRGMSRTKSIVIVFAAAVLIVGGVFGSVIPQIVIETRELSKRVPTYTARLQDQVQNWINNPPRLLQRFLKSETKPMPAPSPEATATNASPATSPTEAVTAAPEPAGDGVGLLSGTFNRDTLQSATRWVGQFVPKALGRVAAWFGIIAGLALIPIYAFYLLLEKRGIESSWTDYLPVSDSRFKEEVVFVLRSINEYLIAFFRGQVLVAICDAVLYTIGFLLVGLPFAVLLGFAAVFLTLIPFLGAIALCITALIIAAVQYGDWLHPAYVLIVFAVVQTLEGVVISPKIMGDRVGLHPLTIIIAVMVGTTLLGGLLGGILAIPLTAVLRVVMGRYIWKRPLPAH